MNNKLYKCQFPDCNIEQPILSGKMCNYHKKRKEKSSSKRYVYKQSQKNKLKKKEISYKMNPFWEFHLENVKKNPFCQNCGCKIQGNINNLAHILPKRLHKEVQSNLDNCIYLCGPFENNGKNCHAKFDSQQASNKIYLLPCWTIAVDNYLKFREYVFLNSKYKDIFENWFDELNDTNEKI